MAYYKCGSVYTTQNSNTVIDTASGPIANFETPLAMPLLDAQIDVNAVQDLHGQSGAYPAGGGVNKWDGEWEDGGINEETGQDESISGAWRTVGYIPIQPDTTYFICTPTGVTDAAARLRFYDENKNYIGSTVPAGYSRTLNRVTKTPANAYYLRFSPANTNCPNHDISLNYPSTNTAYHPYSNICPIDGWDEISVAHRGANLFDISTKTNGVFLIWSTGNTYNDSKSIVSDYIEVKEGVTFITNYNAQWCCYDKDKNYLGNIVAGLLVKTSGNDTKINTIPSGYGVYYLRVGYRSTTNNDEDMTEKTDIMFNAGSVILPFEPYNGSTTVIQLNNTYYGGHFTQDKDGKRELVVTHKLLDWSVPNWNRTKASNWNSYLFYCNVHSQNALGLCEIYDYGIRQATVNLDNYKFLIAANGYLYIRNDDYTDVPTFVNDMSNYKLVYELAEPFTVALPDGQPIKSLPGINNIFADTGDTSLQFRKIG